MKSVTVKKATIVLFIVLIALIGGYVFARHQARQYLKGSGKCSFIEGDGRFSPKGQRVEVCP